MVDEREYYLKIFSSPEFMHMPLSSQSLYVHLVMRANDKGVVDAHNVIEKVGASEEDLKTLACNGFVTVLDEEFAAINDWNEHNEVSEK